MKFKNPIRAISLIALLAATSGCDLFAAEEVIDPVTGAVTVVPAGPPAPSSEPVDRGGRGGGGGGGWTP